MDKAPKIESMETTVNSKFDEAFNAVMDLLRADYNEAEIRHLENAVTDADNVIIKLTSLRGACKFGNDSIVGFVDNVLLSFREMLSEAEEKEILSRIPHVFSKIV